MEIKNTELNANTPPVFKNYDDIPTPATLTNKEVAEMAFRAAWANRLYLPKIIIPK